MKLTVAKLIKKFLAFYVPQSSLLSSQEPATGPYPQINPVHILKRYFFTKYVNITQPSTSKSVSQVFYSP
jgi:hypothetical protein